jgi:hypothetical protein
MQINHLERTSQTIPEHRTVIAHNLYSVSRHRQHYLQCLPQKEETLGERVAAAAAFLSCIALLIIITG